MIDTLVSFLLLLGIMQCNEYIVIQWKVKEI